MTARDGFEGRFFDLLMDRLDKQDRKLDEIHTQVKYTNGRVTKLEETTKAHQNDIDHLKNAKSTRFNLEPRTAYIVAICALIVLSIVAVIFKVPLGNIL